jgi:hypothetical protein
MAQIINAVSSFIKDDAGHPDTMAVAQVVAREMRRMSQTDNLLSPSVRNCRAFVPRMMLSGSALVAFGWRADGGG